MPDLPFTPDTITFETSIISDLSVVRCPVKKVNAGSLVERDDEIAVEEPLEIRLSYGPTSRRAEQTISVTMRTPGQDAELATGFLFTEGIIASIQDIIAIREGGEIGENRVYIELRDTVAPDMGKLDRHFYTTSSCGVCGKSSIDAIKTVRPNRLTGNDLQVSSSLICSLPERLRLQQNIFQRTGGLHASALFDGEGKLLHVREDIGRHNALDKLIGLALQKQLLPLGGNILLLSGRASFELLQKAAVAGIPIVIAIGPPSSLAVQMAQDYGITLTGFLREEKFNIYTGSQRIILA